MEWNRGRGTRAVKRALRRNRNDRVAVCPAVIIEKPSARRTEERGGGGGGVGEVGMNAILHTAMQASER